MKLGSSDKSASIYYSSLDISMNKRLSENFMKNSDGVVSVQGEEMQKRKSALLKGRADLDQSLDYK
jgi:hypothetical protein